MFLMCLCITYVLGLTSGFAIVVLLDIRPSSLSSIRCTLSSMEFTDHITLCDLSRDVLGSAILGVP